MIKKLIRIIAILLLLIIVSGFVFAYTLNTKVVYITQEPVIQYQVTWESKVEDLAAFLKPAGMDTDKWVWRMKVQGNIRDPLIAGEVLTIPYELVR